MYGPQRKLTGAIHAWAHACEKAADKRSGVEEAMEVAKAQMAVLNEKMGEKLWEMYGPHGTLPVAFQAWAQACETGKLEVARAKHH